MGCTASQPQGVDSVGDMPNGTFQQPKRQDSALSMRSNGSSKQRRGGSRKGAAPQNRNGISHPQNGERNINVSPTSDPRYLELWDKHRQFLLDPADVHATMEACMSRMTNHLNPTQITFLQRKIRSIIRANSQVQDKGGRIFRGGNSNASEEQEVKTVAEKYHLLSKHVVRKVLPKTPFSLDTEHTQEVEEDPSISIIADNVYLLALFLHESLWDRLASIARETAEEAGAQMDVNKYSLPESPPKPCFPTLVEVPDLPAGISLHALTFLISLALNGSRIQRLQLLFYLLLPSDLLQDFLEHHSTGGPPVWLLEVGSQTIFSLSSLSHYYFNGSAFTPAALSHRDTFEEAPQTSRLVLDAKRIVSLIKSILTPDQSSMPEPISTFSNAESPASHPTASPGKKTSKMRRRASNQMIEEDVVVVPPQTEVMERMAGDKFDLDDYVSDNRKLQTTLHIAMEELESENVVTMAGFLEFCERTLDDDALSALMNRFFAHSIMPSPSMELELVANRWRDWQEKELPFFKDAMNDPDSNFESLTQSVRKILLTKNEDAIEASSERLSIVKPFGGIGGVDGRGALGFGVMYCIDKTWWDSWGSYVGWKWATEEKPNGLKDEKRRKRRRPGSLSSEPLLDRFDDGIIGGTMGSYELMKKDLRKDVDFVIIPSGVWDALYELYGGGPPLPRFVLPPQSKKELSGRIGGNSRSRRQAPSESQLDTMAAPASGISALRIPDQLQVLTHPWVLHFHLCDPHQPYRRGDAGPLSIRVMTSPDQPLWRVCSELSVRLPFHLYRVFNDQGFSKARLWKRTASGVPIKTGSNFGPWALLCKSRYMLVPKDLISDVHEKLAMLEENWKTYADNASVESMGLVNGDTMMVECAMVSRTGEVVWPREAAAKAGRAKHLQDKDAKFRRLLKGVDEKGHALPSPPELVGMRVDAMDTSGKWFEVNIDKVQTVDVDTDEEGDSSDAEHEEQGKGDESRQVLVDFTEHGGHSEWIDVTSDRLASAGRFTIGAVDKGPESQEISVNSGLNASSHSTKPQPQVKKASDSSDSNSKLCSIPGFGACGLLNLGNTCYANSAIQCVSYLPLLRAYLLSAQYKATGDLNKDNPLGTEGKLLEEFAELLRQMWSAKIGEKSPTRFRVALGRANELFQGADQQDSQEFLSFILDVLHEDSNRVRKKPAVEGLEDDWKKKTPLPRVGEEEWRRFLRRNRSIMADVGMGQVLNTVTCPVCNFSSRNFDPFNLLSLPFPTVADVIFKCYVVRRASANNTPWVLNRAAKGSKAQERYVAREEELKPSKPPSGDLVVEEYIIAMSRVADSSDLKLQIQSLTGIPSSHLSVCRGEPVAFKDSKEDSVVKMHTQITLLTDKEGPCSQLANRQRANSEDLASSSTKPSLIVAFESTLRSRPSESDAKTEDSSDSNADDDEDQSTKAGDQGKNDLQELSKLVEQYGNNDECRLYDTDTLLIAKAVSRSLWPQNEADLQLGLRVDAIDQKQHWFPGSIVEIIENDPSQSNEDEKAAPTVKVRVHFDNFSTRWDEKYTIDEFKSGSVKPLYSHAQPRSKPTEFVVHNRYTDRTSRMSNLFGQSFYVQCNNEWTTARAGAQILAQAARFLKLPSQYSDSASGDIDKERRSKIQRLYDRTQSVVSDLIDLLIAYDRSYIHGALGMAEGVHGSKEKPTHFRNPGYDASALTQDLVKKVNALLNRLPFEVRVCTIDSTLGGSGSEELAFPFSLMRTIGNYMNARHAIVLQWREPPSDKKATNSRNGNYLGAPVMYSPPPVAVDAATAGILVNQTSKKSSNARGSGGLPLGVCLTEYCKLQQLPTWRCPKCKDFRDGKQNMAFWRLPDLLTIHLKRFNCSARWREKITTKVNFPLTGLDLQEWCHAESPVVHEDSTGEVCIYDLVGVLNHYGGMTGGHYVATCKASACSREGSEEVAYDFNGIGASKPTFPETDNEQDSQTGWKFGRQKTEVSQKKISAIETAKAAADSAEPLWLQFDDDLVEPIPPRCVISETAYVLFYRRRRITPANIARYSTLE